MGKSKGNRILRRLKYSAVQLSLSFAWLALCCDPSQAQTAVVAKDGLTADLRISGDQALVRWRFVSPLSSPLKEISGQIDGASLGLPNVSQYPRYGEVTRVLALIDTTKAGSISGTDRVDGINQQVAAALTLLQQPQHVQVAFGVYSSETRLVVAPDFNKLVTAFATIKPVDEQPDLPSALIAGIGALSSLPAQRRALFVFTDGHSGVPLKDAAVADCNTCVPKIAEAAFRSGVSINFILSESSRSKDLDSLKLLSERTGGQVVSERDTIRFMAQPLRLVDSGGSAAFPIPQRVIYFWQSDPTLTITFQMGADEAVLTTMAPLPRATVLQTLDYAWVNFRWYFLSIALLLLLMLVAALAWLIYLILRRKRKPAKDPARRPALAVLQDTDNGTVYSVQASPARIGRFPENEVVISDKSVSRLHAVLECVEDGSFLFQNRSDAGNSLVNGQAVENCKLSDGDVISLGATSLRFARVPSW